MQNYRSYKIIACVLSALVIIESVLLIRLWTAKPKKIAKPAIALKGKIAIVIDDWGYNLNNLRALEQIKYPLTCALLPNLNYSRLIAEELHKNGFQVILHLPMEPHEKLSLEQNTITTSMDEPAITGIIRRDLEDIPYVSGVSNHMGSKATENIRVMGIIFKELKRRRIYFLDSFVSAESVCWDVANKMRLGFARRDVFLDNKQDAGYIRAQIDKLKRRAGFYGQAIGIGHDQKITLEVLKEEMPELEKEGYKFVFVSELIH